MTDNLYQQPDVVNKRPRYFDGQFLKVDDFINEQQYHIDRSRRVSQHLHVAGILTGLEVQVNGNALTLTPGAAIDPQGRQIILHESAVYQAPTDDADSAQTITVGSNQPFTIDLAAVGTQATYQLYITWDEVGSDEQSTEQGGSAEATRFHERPRLSLSITAPDNAVALAKIKHNGTAWVKEAFAPQYSGLELPTPDGTGITLRAEDGKSDLAQLSSSLTVAGDVTANQIKLADGPTLSVVSNLAKLSGSLTVTESLSIESESPTLKLNSEHEKISAIQFREKYQGKYGYGFDLVYKGDENLFYIESIEDGKPQIQHLAINRNSESTTLYGNIWLKEYKTGGLAYLQARDDNSNRDIGLRIRTQKKQDDPDEPDKPILIEALTINHDGKVGIGTVTPSEQLEIRATDPTLKLFADNGKKSTVQLRESTQGKWGVDLVYDGSDDTFHIEGVDNDSSAGKHLSIQKTAGNVGIGFTNPSARLAVNGGLHIGGKSDPGKNNLQVDGKIGIGTKPINTRLTVFGDVLIINGSILVAEVSPIDHKTPTLQFDGIKNYIDLGENLDLANSKNVTIEVWFNCYDTSGFSVVCDKWKSFVIAILDGKIGFAPYRGNWQWSWNSIEQKIFENTWYHAALVFHESGSLNMYIRGDFATYQQTSMGEFDNNSSLLSLGYRHYTDDGAFKGAICEFRIWRKALSEEEIIGRMKEKIDKNNPDLIEYLPLDEGEGTTVRGRSNQDFDIIGAEWFRKLKLEF